MDLSNLKLDDLIVAVAAMLAALPGLIALWQNKEQKKADKEKTSAETEKTSAETESIHAEVADKWAGQVAMLLARVVAIETELRQVKTDLDEWKDWANRLVHQVKAFGHEPVPFKIKPKA